MDSAEVLAALAAALPSEVLISDRDVTQSLSHDEAEWAPVGEALALIRATTSAGCDHRTDLRQLWSACDRAWRRHWSVRRCQRH